MHGLTHRLAHRILHQLPMAVLVLRGARVIAANNEARELLGARARPGRADRMLGDLARSPRAQVRLAGPPARRLRTRARRLSATGLDLVVVFPAYGARDAEAAQSESTAQLATAREIIESMRSFVRMINHELRTPMTAIDMQAQRILRKIPEDSELVVNAKRMRQSVATMDEVLNSSITAQRMSPDSFEITRAPQDLAALVMRAADRVAAGEDDSVRVDVRVDEDAPRIPIDAARIIQVLNNLIENGIKYSPGVHRVEVVHYRDGDWQAVEIRDQGIGLPNGTDQGLYEIFSRGSNTRSIPGTGIGLHVVRSIVEQHGGRIRLTPNAPAGTVATICLPAG